MTVYAAVRLDNPRSGIVVVLGTDLKDVAEDPRAYGDDDVRVVEVAVDTELGQRVYVS